MTSKNLIIIIFLLIGLSSHAQKSDDLILLIESTPEFYEEVQVNRRKQAPSSVLKHLKRKGFDLKKLQRFVDRSDENIFMFTKFEKHERQAQLGVKLKQVKEGVLIKSIYIERTKKFLQDNDIVTGLNGRLISKVDDLQFELDSYKGGEEIELTLLRNGQEMTEKFELDQKQYYLLNLKPIKVELVPMYKVSSRKFR